MRKIIVVFLMMILAKSLIGQNYIPLPMENAIWCSTYGCTMFGEGWCDKNYQYLTNGDTIINSLHYTKIIRNESSLYVPCSCGGYYTLMRQDTSARKVYVRSNNTDIILYDFTQNIGDTVNSLIFPSSSCPGIIITDIDSILIDSVFHRRLVINQVPSGCVIGTNYFIEGVGCSGGLFEMEFGFEWGGYLFCVMHNGQTIYPDSTYNCSLHAIKEESKVESTISIFPNPADKEISIDNPAIKNKAGSISIYNLQGQLPLQQTAKEEKTEIDVSAFSKGMYFVRMETDGGTVCGKFVKK